MTNRLIHFGKRLFFVFIAVCFGLAFVGIYKDKDLKALELFKGKKGEASVEAERPISFTELAKKMKPTVINIRSTKLVKHPGMEFWRPFGPKSPFRDFFGEEFFERFFREAPPREYPQNSLGSGFIIDKQGYILTNNHVIEKADKIKVILSDEEEFDAEVVGRDPKTDIALIKIEPTKPLQAVTMGNSDKLQVGEWIIAIGNPFGLEHTVTAGIVSAKGRVIGSGPYDDFIQTDASINPGNSGGPLINMRGEVVGINTVIIAGGQGIGFAIPINMAKQILPQLKERGEVTRGWLGVKIQNVTPELAEQFGLEKSEGALVAQVIENSPAKKAGIKREDIIIQFDDKKIYKMNQLPRIVANTPVGNQVEVKVIRQGSEKTLKVVVGKLKEEKVAKAEGFATEKELGLTVQDLTPEIAKHLGISEKAGVLVSEVKMGSPAQEADIRRGDIIKEIDRQAIEDLKDYKQQMAKLKAKDEILILIQREENTFFLVLKR
ncbi:MAG: DegQ family serine endoprotease [Syntrophobacterales bacterium]|nr:MAG: DegQ family serine endoprotease [Syntrophobacterales bacterium]